MEDRYDIRGKIGQGGLGAVYRGYDTRMHREVAIKRISRSDDDPELLEESTRQLIKEAGALASLQHPNIVTVYDVGSDEDGPYVVMELISGKTLDELIEHAPLTWQDFRELALQTQEALIAAQELNLIHSDLKPSNLMLTWLPSGKFQVKIVDFGLATLTQAQSHQDHESLDAVFGSVFFMPPEQFERSALNASSDIYSMGCVYYQALTGIYPFDGTTGNDVMNSHLQHTVKPLQDVRADIPLWACDWIMWHIKRFANDRPASSREALAAFLKNDRLPNPPMSLGYAKPVAAPPRPRLAAPKPGPPLRGNAPTPKLPAKPKVAETPPAATPSKQATSNTQHAPQALAPPEGCKPSVHTDLQDLQPTKATQTSPGTQKPAASATASKHPHAKKPASTLTETLAKKQKIAILIAGLVLLIVLSAGVVRLVLLKLHQQSLTEILAQAENPATAEIKISSSTLQLLLDTLAEKDADATFPGIGKALTLSQATDGVDIDGRIAAFATKRPDLPLNAREMLIGEVLQARNNSSVMPMMLEFAVTSKDPALVASALQAVRKMAGDEQFQTFLKLIESTDKSEIRDAAELNICEILKKSKNPKDLAKSLETAKQSTFKPEIKETLTRLLSFATDAINSLTK